MENTIAILFHLLVPFPSKMMRCPWILCFDLLPLQCTDLTHEIWRFLVYIFLGWVDNLLEVRLLFSKEPTLRAPLLGGPILQTSPPEEPVLGDPLFITLQDNPHQGVLFSPSYHQVYLLYFGFLVLWFHSQQILGISSTKYLYKFRTLVQSPW